MQRIAGLTYGTACYLIFFASFLYLIGFVGNLWVPVSIDGEPATTMFWAAIIDLALILLFGLQHSIMARPNFKKWLVKFMPELLERSTYVLATSVVLIILFANWQTIDVNIWNFEHPWIVGGFYTLYFAGWTFLLVSSLLISHFDLFGLRQTWLFFKGQPYTQLEFKLPLFYRYVRHPIYVGILLAFWSTPTMTLSHLLFSMAMTAYVFIGIRFEERDLVREHGESYIQYQNDVPMLLPGTASKQRLSNRQNVQ